MSTASNGKSSGPKAKHRTSDNILLSDVTYFPKTCSLDAIRPSSEPTPPGNIPTNEPTRVPLCTRGNGDDGVGPLTPGLPQQYRRPGAMSSDTVNQEDHLISTGDLRCRPAHSRHRRAPPGTSPTEKRPPMRATLPAIDAQATAVGASVPASVPASVARADCPTNPVPVQ